MDVIKVMETFPTQEHCIDYLERLRWEGAPECPHCESIEVRRRNEQETVSDAGTVITVQGNACTLFHGEPEERFRSILMANAKKSLRLSHVGGATKNVRWQYGVRWERITSCYKGSLRQMRPISVGRIFTEKTRTWHSERCRSRCGRTRRASRC